MKKVYFILTVFTLLTADIAYGGRKDRKRKANSTEQGKPFVGPEVKVRRNGKNDPPSTDDQYIYFDSTNLWQKIVYRAIEIHRSSANYDLLSISDANGSITTLTNVVAASIKNHSIKSYGKPYDTALQVVTEKGLVPVADNKNDSLSINNILVKENWHFNKVEGKMLVKILWLGFNSIDEKETPKQVFWVRYEDVVPLLMQYKIKEPQKENSLISLFDFFEKRMFSSRIYKVGDTNLK